MDLKEQMIRKLLFDLTINSSAKGYFCVLESLIALEKDEQLLSYISKGLYVDVAFTLDTTVACVERNIRSVKEKAWKRRRNHFVFEGLEEIPTNGEFLSRMMYQLQLWENEYRKSLRF